MAAAEVIPRTKGAQAEQLVHERLRAALPKDFRIYPNVALGRSHP